MKKKLYMCNALGIDIDAVACVQSNGTGQDFFSKHSICNIVRSNKYTFMCMEKAEDINRLITRLDSFSLSECMVYIGSHLGFEDQSISETGVTYLFDAQESGVREPAAVIIENPSPKDYSELCLDNECYSCGDLELSSPQFRKKCISALGLDGCSVLYHIGAGAGLLAVEASFVSTDIEIYAIEKKPERYVLINKNRCRFACDNVRLINGCAPEVLEYVPTAPTHVLISGCVSEQEDIISFIRAKYPYAKIAVVTDKSVLRLL